MKTVLTGSNKAIVGAGSETFWKSELEWKPKQIVLAPQYCLSATSSTELKGTKPGTELIRYRTYTVPNSSAVLRSQNFCFGSSFGSDFQKVSAPAQAPTKALWVPVFTAFKWKSRFFMTFRKEYQLKSWSRSRNFSIPDSAPAPAKSSGSLRLQLRLHNTTHQVLYRTHQVPKLSGTNQVWDFQVLNLSAIAYRT